MIIPTRNRPEFLNAAVASVLAQSLRDLELLVVNDGDAPLAPFDDARVRVIDNHSRGAVPARNFGIAEAASQFIAFLDDDDQWLDPQHLARAIAVFEKGADFYFANGVMVFPDGANRAFAHNATAQSLAHDNTILISAVCYRAALHDTLGTFDEALPYYWDWDWYLRVARAKFVLHHCVDPAVNIRVHAQNMSGDGNIVARRANLDLLCRKHKLGKIALKSHADFVS